MSQLPTDVKPHTENTVVQAASSEETLQSDIRHLGKGAGIALVGRVGGRVLLLLNQVILARLLGPTEFGLFALGWTVLQMGSLISPLGLHQGIIRYGSQYWRADSARLRAVLQQSLGLVVLLGSVGALTLFIAAPWLAFEIFREPGLVGVFRGFALALALAAILRVAAAGTRISQRMQFSVLTEDLLPPLVQLMFVLLLVVLLNEGLKGAVLSATVGFAAGVGLGVFFLWRLFGKEIRSTSPTQDQAGLSVGELLAFSLPASLAGIFVMLTLRVDRLLVGYFLPASEVGIYQAASQAAMLSAMILGAFNAIFSPMIARLYHQGEMGRLNELFKVSTKWGLYVSLPPFLVLAVAPREVMTVVFGEPYASGAIPMVIMAGAQLFNAATGAVGLMLVMSGHPQRWLGLSTVSFALNVLLCVLLIPKLGLLGAALAMMASVMMLFGGGLAQVHSLLGLCPYDRRYIKGITAALVALIGLLGEKVLLQVIEDFLLMLSLYVLSVLILFFGTFLALGIDAEDWQLLRKIRW